MTESTPAASSPSSSAASADRPADAPADLPAGTVAMLVAETLPAPLLRALTAEMRRRGTVHAAEVHDVPVRAVDAAEPTTVRAARWSTTLTDSDDGHGHQLLVSLLEDAAAQLDAPQEATVTVLPAALRPADPGMLIMDVDSTLIDQEVIELLAAHADREAEVAEVTERAMRGELDFAASLHERVAALAGLPTSVIASTVEAVSPTCGAAELIAACSRRGWPVHAVSGGFLQVLEPLAARLGLSEVGANDLAVAEDALTGAVAGPVVDRAAKAARLHEWAAAAGVPSSSVVAIGDGANDLDMVAAAGVGVAFCPKPALADQADLVIRHRSLDLVRLALGLD